MNLAVKDIVKEEMQNFLDVGFSYPIFDNEWVSPEVVQHVKGTFGCLRLEL